MKISCQSCQAKYTIADEKVLGKIVKIRCKKCGATIVINGNETAASAPQADEAPAQNVFDYTAQAPGGGEQWTVNVADGDQRTMTSAEIIQEFKSGVVNEETFCWKDGMSDWLPLREIDELYSAATGGGEPALSPDHTHQEPSFTSASSPEAGGFLFGGGGGGLAASGPASSPNGNGSGGALFASSSPASAPPGATTAARRQGGRGGGGADLFGGVAQAGGEDDVMTSAPAGMPQVSNEPGKLTGQRNENSVLFSLNALTSNAPKEETAAPAGGVEGSGLIDIRALSATMGQEKGGKANHIDDIMNLGGGGAFSAALAAPVLAPPSMDSGMLDTGAPGAGKNNKMLLVAIVGGAAIIAIAILLVFALKKPEPPAAALVPTAMTPQVDTPPPVAAPTDTGAAAGGTPSTAAAPGTGQAVAANQPKAPSGGTGGSKSAPRANTGGGGNDTPAPPPAAVVPPPSKPSSFADALKSAAGDTGGSAAPAAPQGGSAPFDRGAATAALGSVNVASCRKGDGPTGAGHVKVTFAPSGNVSSAVVDAPPFAGTPVGGCVAGKFRGAHIPAFSGGAVTVGKSFVIN
jgi:predicted Zn finger-like uncharacterized protein